MRHVVLSLIVWIFLLPMVLFTTFPALLYAETPKPVQELTFLNWADYIAPEIVDKFEKKFNAKVRIITFESDDIRTQMILSTGGENFDVVLVDGNSLEAYTRRKWLTPIDKNSIPHLKEIHPRWQNAYTGSAEFAVPYFWGTTGIAYRSDLVKTPITKWMQIYKPAKELQGKILMLPQSRELIDITLKTLGYSVNSTDNNAYKQARTLLKSQKPHVKKYDIPAVHEGSALINGSIVAAMTYNGDALMLNDINENIVYTTPDEGGVLWVDYLAVPAKSRKKKLAWEFINFLNEPEIAAESAQYAYYASPNLAAEKLLPKEFLEDPKIYPSNEILQRYEIEEKLPPRIQQLRSSIFSEITRGKI